MDWKHPELKEWTHEVPIDKQVGLDPSSLLCKQWYHRQIGQFSALLAAHPELQGRGKKNKEDQITNASNRPHYNPINSCNMQHHQKAELRNKTAALEPTKTSFLEDCNHHTNDVVTDRLKRLTSLSLTSGFFDFAPPKDDIIPTIAPIIDIEQPRRNVTIDKKPTSVLAAPRFHKSIFTPADVVISGDRKPVDARNTTLARGLEIDKSRKRTLQLAFTTPRETGSGTTVVQYTSVSPGSSKSDQEAVFATRPIVKQVNDEGILIDSIVISFRDLMRSQTRHCLLPDQVNLPESILWVFARHLDRHTYSIRMGMIRMISIFLLP